MTDDKDKSPDKRIVLKVPVYMPELKDDLGKYPENCRAKRILQLASIGLLVQQGRMGAVGIADDTVVSINTGSAATTPAAVAGAAVKPEIDDAVISTGDNAKVTNALESVELVTPQPVALPPAKEVVPSEVKAVVVADPSPTTGEGRKRHTSTGFKVG